ncbi:MAG: hypothetical protein NTX44_07630 [Ignavibacteriales bacterium]|nr:hypothetical protein [Ignavibacteriales bacterium]
MNLLFNTEKAGSYKSNSQIARVMTESWISTNSYCPNCGNSKLCVFNNNRPVADFYCHTCKEEYELKSNKGELRHKIIDGAYESMIKRISSTTNPNLFLLTYDVRILSVVILLIIPKQFFIPSIIEKRNPLSMSARRAGWIGCYINIKNVPILGRIYIIKNSTVVNQKDVLRRWKQTTFLNNVSFEARGWTLEILSCIDKLRKTDFDLDELYKFEPDLKKKFPNNNFIKDKIRQQLQILRDKGILKFVSKGKYRNLRNGNI